MAITSITITQENKIGSVDLLAVHSPLIFLIEVGYTGATPETLFVDIIVSAVNGGTFKCIAYADSTGIRTFAFIADEIIRGLMSSFDDTFNSVNTVYEDENLIKFVTLDFYDIDETFSDSVSFVACHAARQFGESPAMVDVYNNESDLIIGVQNFPTPVYFYNVTALANINILPGGSAIGGDSDRFYKKIFTTLTEGEIITQFEVNSSVVASKNIRVKNPCPGYRVLKYLDKNGQYRIFPFDKYYTINDKPDKVGDTNNFFTNLLTETNSKNIGYRNEREIGLIAIGVQPDELLLLADLFKSPRVYLYIGTAPEDTANNWLLLKNVTSSDNIVKNAKDIAQDVSVTITLPEQFQITML